MSAENPLQKTDDLLQATTRLASKRKLGDLQFTFSDLGDLYHIYGVNATAEKFLAMLVRRNNNQSN